jgi:hypothetical protein
MNDLIVQLTAQASARGGFLLTRDLRQAGVDKNRLLLLLKLGTIVKIRYGAYALTSPWHELDPVAQHAVITRSVLARADDGAVASHQSAAALHGIDLWRTDLSQVHLTRVDGRHGRRRAGVVWHEPTITQDDVAEVDGAACTSIVRAALETTSLTGVEEGVVALSSALRRSGMTPPEVAEHVGRFRSWVNADEVRLAATLADGRFESVGESRSFVMFWRHGIDLPEPQVVIVDVSGGAIARVDFAWTLDRHVGEFDGLIKYGRLNLDPSDPGRALVREKVREDRVREVGHGMSRWGWVDLEAHRQAGTCARIDAARARSRRLHLPVSRPWA